jgi:ribosomal protein S18 acetylase RimI-like enzyme
MVYLNNEINKSDISKIAKLHLLSLDNSLISFLGIVVVKKYYEFIKNSPVDFLFLLREGNIIVGACVLSKIPKTLMKRFIKRNWLIVGINVLISFLSSQIKRKRIFNFLLKRSLSPNEVHGLVEILQIFTDPDFRNLKIGTRLLEQVETFLKKEEIHKYYLKTFSSEYNDAIHFYKQRNFKEVGKSLVGDRNYVYYIKFI